MSKGDKPRDMNISKKEYDRRWEKAFGKKNKYKTVKVKIESVTPMMDNSEAMESIMKKNNIKLLNDNSLEAELDKVRQMES